MAQPSEHLNNILTHQQSDNRANENDYIMPNLWIKFDFHEPILSVMTSNGLFFFSSKLCLSFNLELLHIYF